jgi:hypothetical protein
MRTHATSNPTPTLVLAGPSICRAHSFWLLPMVSVPCTWANKPSSYPSAAPLHHSIAHLCSLPLRLTSHRVKPPKPPRSYARGPPPRELVLAPPFAMKNCTQATRCPALSAHRSGLPSPPLPLPSDACQPNQTHQQLLARAPHHRSPSAKPRCCVRHLTVSVRPPHTPKWVPHTPMSP